MPSVNFQSQLHSTARLEPSLGCVPLLRRPTTLTARYSDGPLF